MTFVWTEDNVERAKVMWKDGSTATQIALDIGAPSRNSVIGKLTRLGVQRPEHMSIQNGELGGKKNGGGKTAKPKFEGKPKPSQTTARKFEQSTAPAPAPMMIPLVYLSDHTCKWPIGTLGEEGGGFCGNRTADGKPYCGFHCTVAYLPPDPKNNAKALLHSLRRYA